MNLKPKTDRWRRPVHEKIAHISRRLFNLGRRNSGGDVIIPSGFCGAQADLWWRMQYAERLRTSREIVLLTKRLQMLVAKQAAELNADSPRGKRRRFTELSYLRLVQDN